MKVFKFFAALGLGLGLMSCGAEMPSFVSNVKFSSYESPNHELMVQVQSEFVNTNMQFSQIQIPIIDPKNNQKVLGDIKLERVDSKNLLTLTLNASAMKLGGTLTDNNLPNGTSVPVSGLTSLMAVAAGANSRVYLGENSTSLMLGVAVAIKQFDSLGQFFPIGGNIFMPFPAQNGIGGVGGIFMGPASGQNGLALFVTTSKSSLGFGTGASVQKLSGSSLQAVPATVSNSKMRQVGSVLKTLDSKRAKLHAW